MEVRIYNRMLDLVGIIENQTSILWNRKYNSCGDFEAHFPITESNMKLLKRENLVYIRGNVEAGIIESVRINESADVHEVVITGRFLSSYLGRRVIKGTMNFNGTVENAIRKILTDMTAFPLFELGSSKGYTERIEFQATYKNVLDYVVKLCQSVNYGFRLRPDFVAKKMIFELYKGEDHSINQHDRNHVEFSERYNNIERIEYTENDQLYSNVAYVGGEGEGSARKFTTTGDTSLTGFDRREMFVDARDLKSEGLTSTEYINVLKTKGNERLNESILAQSVECEVVPTGNFDYRRDYELGDIITVIRKPYGIKTDLRITELTEIYEHGRMNVSPTFGTPLPTYVDWSE